mmetsp:Transcript_46543/g.124422  ORF Transcript_46543/g.124422 Transcript_46543/m.124422 type:complete len:169 (+) Transcript_46543:100-606(+)
MKPDWDKLAAAFKDSAVTLIADVDCTAGGKALCEQIGVRGYPTIKFGDPDDLQEYQGGRDLPALEAFAAGLGPQCGPANLGLCDDAKKAQIEEFMALPPAKREEMIKAKESEIAALEEGFKTMLEALQKSYSDANEKKDKDVEALKASGLGLLKSVNAHVKKTGSTEL